ncbi:hypothetical protein [Actinoplanes utahensis]|uniref:Uncharacterized protein n=1 Tax=Actinoplanes utahensis TaxID=1869 RepID=A0A0A6UI57_ACTUT|nr:hypothetical protein [Actinoplanes utahensis]KHD75745.1 hypothetical protein MB27_21255 [Actinoplanes utahensis]
MAFEDDETAPVPANVAALATAHDLGDLVGRRGDDGVLRAVLYALACTLVCLAASAGLFHLARTVLPATIWLAGVALLLSLALVGWTVFIALRGSHSAYAYERGLVHVRNGRARAALWMEMERLEIHVLREAGQNSAYLLRPSGQAVMRVAPLLVSRPDGTRHDAFGTILARRVADAGRPVVHTLISG